MGLVAIVLLGGISSNSLAQTITHIPFYTFHADGSGDLFGASVSGAGDVNGDGTPDLIVGARSEDSNGVNSGSARVFSGRDGSVVFNFDGDSANYSFGGSVSGAGDVNGDGTPDLIVGAIGAGNNGLLSGSARVHSGSDGSVLYNFYGDSEQDRFGASVAGAGDVNGDGRADLIVGAVYDDNNGNGSARVLSGSDGSVLYNFDGDSSRGFFGTSVSGAGDVNGDGIDDFIVGASRGGAADGGYARVFVSQVTATGDFDGDGNVDGDDVDFYIGNLGQLATGDLAQLDLDGDGEVTIADHDLFVTTMVVTSSGVTGALLGDVNLDGTVDVLTDAFALVGGLGQSATSRSQGDLNADGVVDVLNDAFILVSQLGQSNAP